MSKTDLNKELEHITKTSKCLFNNEEVEEKLATLASELNKKLNDKKPIFICVMVGGLITSGRLLPKLDFPLEVDYAHASRYGSETEGKGLNWLAKPSINLENRCIVLIDDVLDGGLTLAGIKDFCLEQGASEVLTTVLIDKPSGRQDGGITSPDFKAITIGNHWLIGLGLDYKGYLRNLPGIYAMDPKVVSEYY